MPSPGAGLSLLNSAIVFLFFRMDDFLGLKQSQVWPVVCRHQKSVQASRYGKKSDRILTSMPAVPSEDSGIRSMVQARVTYPRTIRSALGPNQPSIKWVKAGIYSWGKNVRGVEPDFHNPTQLNDAAVNCVKRQNTWLFKMIVGVLTTCLTQYT